MDKLAQRRKAAQRQEAVAKLTQKVNMEMAKDLGGVKSAAFADGFRTCLIEVERVAWASGTIGALRVRLAQMKTTLDQRRTG